MRKSRLLLSLLLVAAVHAGATTLIPTDVAAQIDEADLIFIGTVVGSESVPVRDGSFAFTYVTFHVEETLKGSAAGPTLTLRMAGGKVRSTVFEIAGAPKFTTGGRHLLFVLGNDRYGIPLSGATQGKLNLVRDPVTQEEILTDDAGYLIDGVRERDWARSGLALDRGGQYKRPERVAEVISQEGVTVVIHEPDVNAKATPASAVLAELRSLIQSRSFAPEFKRGPAVQSASPANVPDTDPDRPALRARVQ